jgi:hypothetical protein
MIRPKRCSRIPGSTNWMSRAQHIGFQLHPSVIERDLFDGAQLGVAGVVNQDADRAMLGADALDRDVHRLRVGEVERQRRDVLGYQIRQSSTCRAVAYTGRPAAWSRSAVARPIPEEQPVIRAAWETDMSVSPFDLVVAISSGLWCALVTR